MNRVAASLALTLLAGSLSLGFPRGNRQQTTDSCRQLSSQVVYRIAPSDVTPPDQANIVSVYNDGALTVFTISSAGDCRDRYLGRRRDLCYFKSKDYGKHWTPSEEDEYSLIASGETALLRAHSNPKVLYRKLNSRGLYLRSADGGKTWTLPAYRVGGETPSEVAKHVAHAEGYTVDVEIAAVHPREPFVLYAAIRAVPWGEAFSITGLPDYDLPGVYVSRDGGESWEKLTDALPPISPLGISPANPKIIYGFSAQGIVKSSDGGMNWGQVGQEKELNSVAMISGPGGAYPAATEVSHGGLDVYQFAMDPLDERILYVVSNKGLYRTSDGGRIWCLLNLGFDEIDGILDVAINPDKSNEIVAGTHHGIFYSSNRGGSFTKIYPNH